MTQKISIALAGNPNCGKTTLFNALTGSHQTVGNWPGVTVEKKSGSFTVNDWQITLVDLPAVYSLQPCDASSEDERVAKNHSISVDLDKLAQELGCPVVSLVASRETGVDDLKQAISRQLENPTVPDNPLVFPKDIADEIHTLTQELCENNVEKAPWIAEQILESDKELGLRTLKSGFSKAELRINALNKHYNGDLDMAIADVRYSFVSKVASSCITRDNEVKQTITENRQDCFASLAGGTYFLGRDVPDVHFFDQRRFRFHRLLRYSFRSDLYRRIRGTSHFHRNARMA